MVIDMWMLWLITALAAEPQDAQTRLGEARVRIDRGDYAGARILADEAQRLDPEAEVEARYLAAVAWELEHEHGPALDGFRHIITTWPEHDRAQDSRFRVALTLADAGAPDQALRALRDLGSPASLRRHDPSGQDAAKVELCQATWLYQSGVRARGERLIERALGRPAAAGLPWFRAAAHTAILADELRRGEDLVLGAGNQEVKRWLDLRTAHYEAANEQLTALVATNEVWFILQGLERFGHHFEDLADDLLAAPVPPGLSDTSRSIFEAGVEGRALDQLVKARSYYQLGLDLALRVNWEGEEADVLQQHVDALDLRIEALDPM